MVSYSAKESCATQNAQHSVHWTAGGLREKRETRRAAFSVSEPNSRQPPVTPTVGRTKDGWHKMKTAPVAVKKSKRPSSVTKAQLRKDELIADLIETRRKIVDITLSFSPTEQDEVFLGIWSIKDLLAHLIGWLEANRMAAKAIRSCKLPAFYAYKDRDWQTYNARLVRKYKRDSLAELMSALQDSHQKLIGLIQTIPAEELEQDYGVRYKGYKVTIARLLQAELKDEKVHYSQMEMFRNRAN